MNAKWLRRAVPVVGGLALSVSAVMTASEPVAVENALVAQPNDQSAKTWVANELHAAFDQEKEFAIIDVNDRFLIKSAKEDGATKVSFAILDGTRAKFPSCDTEVKDGDSRTTWVEVTYSQPDIDGKRSVEVRRTLDFYNNERVYNFTATGLNHLATLEPGVTVGLENGILTYEQTTGPIGTSGNVDALRLAYRLSDDFKDVTSSVELDRDSWMVSTSHASPNAAPIYSVNNNSVVAFMPGTVGDTAGNAVVAAPMPGPGVGGSAEAYALKVSGGYPNVPFEDFKIGTQMQQRCIAFSCLVQIQCLNAGPNCRCQPLQSGPNIGVCLV